jgi:cardiolipin synthase C
MRMLATATVVILLVCVGLFLVYVLNPLPSLAERTASKAFVDTASTRLGKAIFPMIEAHPGTAGIYALPNAHDAFAARMLLAAAAERSLDIQYYIWRKDMTGTMLFDALRRAAERGVRVRLLLDDNNTPGLDGTLAALDSHPNIELRLFNPFVIRKPRLIGYLTDFFRLNRRMHNKSFTADNQATIIGGRNIGDEYFDAAAEGSLSFTDLDVVAVGPVVQELSSDFDRYWASGSSYPADRLLPPATPDDLAQLQQDASRLEHDPAAAEYRQAIERSEFVARLIKGTLEFEWAPTRMVSDDPAKGLGQAGREAHLPQKLREVIGDPTTEFELVSPYFVPTAAGVDVFVAMARRGVEIKILVNSLEATDVVAVHSGYAKRRKPLLEAGITLYEMRLVSPDTERHRSTGPLGSSASSLHAKTMSVDRSRVFAGSFNFDPRSANLNTELGFVMASPALAAQMANLLETGIPRIAYEVHLSDTGKLYWTEDREGEIVCHDIEPRTSVWRRSAVWFLSLLPIEWLL